MRKASEILNEQQLAELKNVLQEAERQTAGEIVPVVASRSDNYEYANFMFGFIISLLAFCLCWFYFHDLIIDGQGWWGIQHTMNVSLLTLLIIMITAFFVGSYIAHFLPGKTLFIGKKHMLKEVRKSAAEAFIRYRAGSTRQGTGVVIYISLYERMVYVQGDAPVMQKFKQEQWQEVCNVIIRGIKNQHLYEGLSAGIKHCGQLLSKSFPANAKNNNELMNEVYLID